MSHVGVVLGRSISAVILIGTKLHQFPGKRDWPLRRALAQAIVSTLLQARRIVAVTLLKPIPSKEVVASTKSPGRAMSTPAYYTGRPSLLTKNTKNQSLSGLNTL